MNMTPQLKETQELLENVMSRIKNVADSINQVYLQGKKDELLDCAEELRHARDKIGQAIEFTYFGQKSGGQRSTAKKAKAVRENGKKGGRPSSKIVTDIICAEDKQSWTIVFNDMSKKKVKSPSIQAVRDAFPPARYKWEATMEHYYQTMSNNE